MMQPKPMRKYWMVGSDMSSITWTASFADLRPWLPRRNLPGPKTLMIAEFNMAMSSRPMAEAVNERYAICIISEVPVGNSIRSELKPKPAIMA